MIGIVEFITARLDEDQADAEAAQAADPTPWSVKEQYAGDVAAADGVVLWDYEGIGSGYLTEPTAAHIARHDPARVLAEVKAKRAIVALHSPVWLVNQWVQDADGQRHQGDLVVCRSCEPRTGFMTDQWPCDTIKLLAAPDAERSEFNPAWRVK